MQMDTTKWILLLVLLFLLLRKSQAQQGSAATRFIGIPGTPGATRQQSWIEKILGTNNTTKTTSTTGGGGGGSSSGGVANRPIAGTAPSRSGWRPPARQPMPLIPSAPSNALIPSIPPDVYYPTERDYSGGGYLPTIPSDTSNIFLTPEEPQSYESVSSSIVDWGAITPAEQTLQAIINQTPYGYEPGDPTYFNPVDTQTIDTSNLGSIAYLPTQGDVPFASSGYDPGYVGGGIGGGSSLGNTGFNPDDGWNFGGYGSSGGSGGSTGGNDEYFFG